MTTDLTIITPCFNEEDSVQICADRVRDVMARELPKVSYEHIFSDNASTDGTVEILRKIAHENKRVKVVVNSRNVGPFRNIYRATSKSSGRAIVPMLPADLQDPVEVIPEFYRRWSAGTLVVFGERTNRQESFFMRTLRGIYYRVIRRFADGEIPINGLISTSRVPARLALLGGFAFSGIGILAGIWSLIANLFLAPGVSHGIPTLIVALFIFVYSVEFNSSSLA